MIGQINGIPSLNAANASQGTTEAGATPGGFQDMLGDMMKKVGDLQTRGDQAVMDLQAGKVANLHEVMLAVSEADLSLRMLVQFRNKAQAVYDEIMRLQL